jgi:hypothetical protein
MPTKSKPKPKPATQPPERPLVDILNDEPASDPPIAEPAPPAALIRETSVAELIPDQANPRVRDDRAKANLVSSLRQFGPARSIVLDGKGIVRAGNGTLEGFVATGGTDVLVVKPKPGQLIAVQRDDWTEIEAVTYSVQDNRATDLSENDDAVLGPILKAVRDAGEIDLNSTGYNDAEIDALLKNLSTDLAVNHDTTQDNGFSAGPQFSAVGFIVTIKVSSAQANDDGFKQALTQFCGRYNLGFKMVLY